MWKTHNEDPPDPHDICWRACEQCGFVKSQCRTTFLNYEQPNIYCLNDVLWCIMMYQNLRNVSSFTCFDFPMMGLSKNRGQACPNGRAKGGEPPVLDVGEYSGISLDRMELWYPIDEKLGNIHITDEISLKYPCWLVNITVYWYGCVWK